MAHCQTLNSTGELVCGDTKYYVGDPEPHLFAMECGERRVPFVLQFAHIFSVFVVDLAEDGYYVVAECTDSEAECSIALYNGPSACLPLYTFYYSSCRSHLRCFVPEVAPLLLTCYALWFSILLRDSGVWGSI